MSDLVYEVNGEWIDFTIEDAEQEEIYFKVISSGLSSHDWPRFTIDKDWVLHSEL